MSEETSSASVAPEDTGVAGSAGSAAAPAYAGEANQANPNQPTQKEIAKAAPGETFTVTIDGQQQTVTREELLKGYQLASSSNKRFREAESIQGQAEELLNLLQQNPRYVLRNLDIDLDQLTNEYLAERIQEELLTPEQRELREYKQKLSRYEEAQRRAEEERLLIQNEQEVEQLTNQMVVELTEAMETSGLSPRQKQKIVKDAIHYKEIFIEQGKDMPIGAIAKKLIMDYKNSQKEMLTQGDVDYLVGILGKDKVNQLIKSQIAKANKMPVSEKPMVSKNGATPKDPERISKNKLNLWKM